MANTFDRTSFIPQKSINTPKRNNPTTSLFFSIALIIFVIALVGSVGTFAYKEVLWRQIESKAVSLERAQEAFDPALIEELTRLNSRLEASEKLLSSHILLTPLFSLLEELTVRNVQLDQFSFSIKESGEIELNMAGKAADYATVVLQSDLFSQNRFLKDQIFSNINLDDFGNVDFAFQAIVDPNLVSFRNNLQNL